MGKGRQARKGKKIERAEDVEKLAGISLSRLSGVNAKRDKFFELISQGMPVDEAAKEAELTVLDLAYLLRNDKEFKSLWEMWEEGMSLIMEGKLTEQGLRGRTVAILNFLRAVDPSRWSERVQVEQMTREEHTVKVLFGWLPPDAPQSLPGAEVKQLDDGVIEIEALPAKSLPEGEEE